MAADFTIIVLARAAVPGTAKTRLIPALGAERAAALQRHLIELALRRVKSAGAVAQLWIGGAIDAATHELAASYQAEVREQPEGNLGERMLAALADAQRQERPGLLIGTDCPAQQPSDLEQAWRLLKSHDVVLQPALDGGYVLIGTVEPNAALFRDIHWGSETVLAQTRSRCAELALRCAELRPLPDLDRPDDMARALARGWIDQAAFA